ncbi:hypothetical protein POM88_054948 [Heracleum sosnowskyi]|uniref:Uncharacterized protein n=1 Tax=Heracleum sosnowskyi TaxID=360622 RepID=A0AAD8LWK4_9APIA|nr:hypothetical protein POM88_054948 [Heracleum sosnowskyi]
MVDSESILSSMSYWGKPFYGQQAIVIVAAKLLHQLYGERLVGFQNRRSSFPNSHLQNGRDALQTSRKVAKLETEIIKELKLEMLWNPNTIFRVKNDGLEIPISV